MQFTQAHPLMNVAGGSYWKKSLVAAVVILWVSNPCLAQNCPTGIPSAGNPLCIPQDRENSPYYQRPPEPRLFWRTRWGAIASHAESGIIRVSSGVRTKAQAESEALSKCIEQSGAKCIVEISYYNQCVAMIVGDNTYQISRAESQESAIDAGMKNCLKSNSNCRVHFVDCSLPQLTR